MNDKECGQCRHFQELPDCDVEGQTWGMCCRYPPRPIVNRDDNAPLPNFPLVYDVNCCGEFAKREGP